MPKTESGDAFTTFTVALMETRKVVIKRIKMINTCYSLLKQSNITNK